LRVYHRELEPLLRYYQADGLLRRVDGSGAPDEVAERLGAVLASAGTWSRCGDDPQPFAAESES
jgi:hypothetical protein